MEVLAEARRSQLVQKRKADFQEHTEEYKREQKNLAATQKVSKFPHIAFLVTAWYLKGEWSHVWEESAEGWAWHW